MFKEARNSWSIFPSSDGFIKEQSKLTAGFDLAVLKGLRFVRQAEHQLSERGWSRNEF
jgi:hypothetical protein